MSAMGENTLDEFVGNLPDCHLAAREYASLKAKLAELEARLAVEKEVTKYLASSIMERKGQHDALDLDTLLAAAGYGILGQIDDSLHIIEADDLIIRRREG